MTKGEALLDKLIYRRAKGKEWLILEQEIHEYLDTEATMEEQNKFRQYTEMLSMTCRAIEDLEK